MALIEELAARAFAARNMSHAKHWRVSGPGSYAAHSALGDFYDAVPGKIDEIIEVYQGAFGLIGDIPEIADEDEGLPSDFAAYLSSEVRWIQANRDAIANGITPIQNLIDDLMACYLKTVYKLVNLR